MPALGRCVSVLILVPVKKHSKARVALVSERGFHTVGLKCTVTTGATEDVKHEVLHAFAPLTTGLKPAE